MPAHEHFCSTRQNKQLQIYYYNKTFSKKMYRFIETQKVKVGPKIEQTMATSDTEVVC